MSSQFIRVHNTFVRLDAIAYIDFLDSGRSMIYVSGMNMEKQHISIEVDETLRLREYIESQAANRRTDASPVASRPGLDKPAAGANHEDEDLYTPKTYRFTPRAS